MPCRHDTSSFVHVLGQKLTHVLYLGRAYRADNKLLLYSGIVQALLAAWALLLSVTAGTQPVVACKL